MSRADKVLAGLAGLQEEGTLCDVELKAEHQTIPAHKAVLAAATPYFAAMFTGKFKETRSRVVTVKDVTFTGLENVIKSIYTTKIDINAENIEDILPAAHLLQMNDTVEECIEWMMQKITKNNCFDFLRLAEKYSIEPLVFAITEFVLNNFVAVSKTEGFTEISQQALCRYLASDNLKTGMDELIVYQAAKTWIKKNKITDSKSIVDIMKNVRFALVPLDPLSMQITIDYLIDDYKDCRRLVGEAMKYHGDVYIQPFYDGNLNKPRGKNGLLVVPNGRQVDGSFTSTGSGNLDFLTFPELRPEKQSKSLNTSIVFDSMNAIQINNFLFLFASKCDGYQNFTMRYDPSNDTWIDMAAVPRQATVGSAIACTEDKKRVFLFGGMHVTAKSKWKIEIEEISAEVFMYDVQKNSGSHCNDLSEGVVYSRAATLGNLIFLTGGLETADRVWAYDVKATVWLTKAKMNHKRYVHCLDAVGQKLYAIGGKLIGAGDAKSVEVYDLPSNQWTIVLPRGPDVIGASSLAIDNKIYIIGGNNSKQVFIYEMGKNKVTHLPQELPSHSRRNVSALMNSPLFF